MYAISYSSLASSVYHPSHIEHVNCEQLYAFLDFIGFMVNGDL